MNDVWCVVIIMFITVVGMLYMAVRDIKAVRRQAPDGKIFIRDFMEMIDDIETALIDSKKDYLEAFVSGNFKFKVRVNKEFPYVGLEYETIPMYKSHAIYIDDELVCRVHIIHKYYKDKFFVEFSSRRKREEIIDIVKRAQKVANEYNHENITNWFSKYDSKSFYTEENGGNK
jgi:hypothetical protein